MILGVVLAGGQSTRFGSDKALAELNGRTMLSGAIEALSRWCEMVVVAGRSVAPAPTVPDWPCAGCGPLGGLAAGLRHAREHGFETVITCGVDSVDLPEDLSRVLSPAPACLARQPVIGHWPTACAVQAEQILLSDGRRSMFGFARLIGAREVNIERIPANINTLADLAAAEKRHGI